VLRERTVIIYNHPALQGKEERESPHIPGTKSVPNEYQTTTGETRQKMLKSTENGSEMTSDEQKEKKKKGTWGGGTELFLGENRMKGQNLTTHDRTVLWFRGERNASIVIMKG